MNDAGFLTGRLLALYDRIGEAPDAIVRLRRFVLDLAVRGKLVEQHPADEPASELLKRIAAEKARLVKVGEIKEPKKSRQPEAIQNGLSGVRPPPFRVRLDPRFHTHCRFGNGGRVGSP